MADPSREETDSVDREKLHGELEKFREGLDPVGKVVLSNYYELDPEPRPKPRKERLSIRELGTRLGITKSNLSYHKRRIERILGRILSRYNP